MVTLIAAVAENGCIGASGTLPWYLPEDLAHFKARTMGAAVLMGRKTWESLPLKFRPLPGRTNIVITRQPRYDVPLGVHVYPSLDAARAAHPSVFVIGGAEIYATALPLADRLEITHVHRTVEGDAFFPSIDPAQWREVERDNHEGYSFVTYERTPVSFTPMH